MGLIGSIGRFFGSGGDSRQLVLLNGQPAHLGGNEVATLNKMAEAGAIQKDISGDMGIGTGATPQGVPAFWFARAIEGGSGAETLANPYASSVWVQRAIKMVSGQISGVDVLFSSKRDPKAKATKENRLQLPDVEAWLRRPIPGFTYSDFVEASVGWLKMAECFWLLDDSTLVPFPEARTAFPPVIVARPDRMRHVVEKGQVVGWVYTPPGRKGIALLPDQVIQLKYWNPYDDFRGLGEYAPAHIATESDWLAGKFGRNLMANNGDLGGIIIAKSGVPSDPQREQIIMDLRAKRAAQLRGELRYTFMTGDIDVKDPKITSVDAAFIGQRLENRHEIALAFGVPPSMFDVKASYSVGSASDYYRMLTDTCIPTGSKFCDALGMLISRMTGQDVEVELDWDDHPVMQSVIRERFDGVDKLWSKGMPMRAIGEYLGLELPHFEGDDIGYLPINVTPAAEAAEPEPPPATNPELGERSTGDHEENEEAPDAVKAMIKAIKSRASQKTSKRARLWESHMRARQGTVRAFESKAARVINEFRGVTIRKLHAAHGVKTIDASVWKTGLIDMIFSAAHFGTELSAALRVLYNPALQAGADQVREEIGAVNPWEFPPAKALEFVTGRTQAVQDCGQTVRNQLNTTLSEGITAGEGIEDLTARVKGVFNSLAKHEARRIAMTETGLAFGFSRHEAMTGAGIRYKSWLSSHGPTVRPAHAEAEERYTEDPIPIDEPFEVGGEYLMHPGDPDGSPENVINCQCIELAVAGKDEE
jgi:hypothetical protein